MVKCSHLNKLFSRYISRIRISGSWICSYLLFRKFTYFSYSTPRLLYSTLSLNSASNLPLHIRTVISQTHLKGFSVLCRKSFIIHFYLCSHTLKIFCIKNSVHVEGRGIGQEHAANSSSSVIYYQKKEVYLLFFIIQMPLRFVKYVKMVTFCLSQTALTRNTII